MGIVKEEYKSEYECRVKELCGAFVTAYCNYFYLLGIGERQKNYLNWQPLTVLYKHSRQFVKSIVTALQKEMILILCSLKEKRSNAKHLSNSVPTLEFALPNYLKDFKSVTHQLKETPCNDKYQCIKANRNKVIAHIDLNKNLDKVLMSEVKQCLDELRKCFNSYLFDEMVDECTISDEQLKRIEKECREGVNQLFSGQFDKSFTSFSAAVKNSIGEN